MTSPNCVSTHHSAPSARRQRSAIVLTAATALVFAGGLATAVVPPKPADPPTALAAPLAVEPLALPAAATAQAPQVLPAASRASSEDGSAIIVDGGIKVEVTKTFFQMDTYFNAGISFSISLVNDDATFSRYSGTPARSGDVSVSYRVLGGSLGSRWDMAAGSPVAGTLTVPAGQTRSPSETIDITAGWTENLSLTGSRWLGGRQLFIQISDPIGAPILAWPKDVPTNTIDFDEHGGLVPVTLSQDYDIAKYMPNGDPEYATKYSPEARANPQSSTPYRLQVYDESNIYTFGRCTPDACWANDLTTKPSSAPYISAGLFPVAIDPDTMTRWGYDGLTPSGEIDVVMEFGILARTRRDASDTCEIAVAPYSVNESQQLAPAQLTYFAGTAVKTDITPAGDQDHCQVENITTVFTIPARHKMIGLSMPLGGPVKIDNLIRASMRITPWESIRPYVTSVTTPDLSSDAFTGGTTVPITVNFSEPVYLTDRNPVSWPGISPRLRLSPTSSTTYPLSPGPSEYTPHALYTPNAWDSTHTYYLTLPEDAAPADFSDAVIEFPDSPAATIKDLFGNTLDSTKGNRRVSFKAKLDPMRSFGALARADDPPAASANDTVKVRLSTEGGVESYRWLTQASEWTRTPQGAYEMNNLVLRAVGSAVDYPLTMGGQGQDQGSFYTADIPARDIVGGTETYVIMWRASSNDPWRFVPTVRPLKVPTSWTSVPVTQAALDEALYPVAGTYYQGDIEAWLAAVVGPADNNATVEWASSDPSVATIAAGTPGADKTRWPARVTFAGRAGKVSFTAKVDNSSTSTFATLKTPEFAVQVGSSDPAVSFVSVQRRLLASRNLPLLVSWSDNVRPRDPAAQFLIEVFEGDYATPDQIPANAPRVYSRVVTGVGAATVPAGALTALSSGGRPAYTARVQITSTTVPGPRSGDVAQILVVPANATVALARLDRYSITDATPSVPISWDVSNNIAGHTELKVTAKRGATVLWTVTDPATATANLPVLAIPANQVKEVYTVEAEVRNDSDPEGYLGKDSAVIEVYREDSLTLQVDGQDVPTAKLGLDYQDGMSVEEIRQSSPSAGLTVNYADFNDSIGTVNDRMRWATSDAATAAIGHKSNTSYTSIADLGYETYSPYDRMLLAGLGDGTASIQVTHAATGLTDTLDVDVQTLKDKLYLFSFDKSRPFTLTWTNGNGRTTTKTFGADGTAVIYEESGIASAVRAIWRDESGPTPTTWKASTANANLISGAGNPLRNEPFTLNVAATRALPNLPIALKDENGNPYTKPVVWRGAAYRNGQLCADTVEANLNSIPTAPDQSGQLLVAFDEQEMTDGGNDRLGVDDVIELMVEVTPVDTAYWPVIASVVTSDPGNIRGQLGSGAVSMAKRPAGPALPHIVLARFDTGDPAVPVQTIGPETAYLGPADAYPHPTLTTLVSLAGTGLTPTFGEIEAKTSIGAAAQVPAGQTSTVLDYAFTQNPYLEITSSLTDANLSGAAVGPGTTATAAARVFAAGRTAPVTAVALSFGLSNMVGVVAPDRDPVLHDRAQETSDAVEDIIRGEGSDGVNFKSELLDVAMDVMHSTSLNLSIVRLDFDLYATSDPTVYQGVIRANASWAGDGEADIAFDYNGVEVEFKLVPSAAEIVDVVETMLDPSSLLSPFDLYKNFGSRIAYNVELHWTPGQTKGSSGSWDMVLTSGQATLFGELGFHVSANMPLFFVVPLTFAVDGTLGIEAGGRVALPTSVFTPNAQKRWPITDLFGTWNVYGGIGAFVGLGFESKIATLKIGVEGSVDLNVEGRYLYRPSLVGTMSEPQSGGKTYDLGKLNSHSAHAKGELAIKGTAKFLWIEATATIKKWTFLDKDLFTAGAYDLIEQWAEDNGVAIAGVQPTANGIDVFTVQPAVMRTQSRDYLQSAATPSSVLPRLAAPGSSLLGETQYPYADPQTTRDGQIVAYLSDQGSPDVNDTRVYYTAAGSTGTEAHVLSDPATDRINNPSGDALPDSDLAMDGTEQFQAASWVRSRAPIGGEVTDASALEMLNNTEVYAAVHTGGAGSASHGNWVTTRLTDNDTADVGPQVAALGNRAVVAWSAPQGTGLNVENAADPNSMNTNGLFNYDNLQDALHVKFYDGAGWSADPVIAYTSGAAGGAVKALKTAMLDQRTAAIAYQVNATGDDSNADGSEIRVAVIDIERGRITSDLRLTNNDTADDNPQITVATVDGAKRFVVAWHATSATGGSDIRLETINPDGTVYPQFVTSLALADDQAAVGQYFRFVRGEALDVASLALVTARNPKVTAGAVEAGAVDVIRFAEHAGQVYPSSPVELFSYNQGQVAESIDAYSFQGTGRICVHALATTYVVGAEPAGGYSYRCGQAVNAIVVDEIAVPTSEVMQGVTLQLPIAVHNRGVNIIEKIEVAGFGPDPFEVDGLVVPPGRTQTVYLPYTVPTVVVDVDWQVKATFAAAGPSGPNAAPVTGTLRLAVPDLGLSQATVVDAGQTTRTIQLAAFNASAAEVPDGATVNVGLYSDADFTEATKLASTTLSDADIALLAGGQTTKQLTWSFRPGAIPAGGTRLFAKIEAIDSQGQVVAEYVTDNNTASIPIMDLSGVGASGRFGAVVRLDNSDPSHSEADLAITNYHSAPAAPGTATVTLLDADQNVIEQRQLDLTAEIAVEQTTTERIVFTKVGVDILVEFWENPSSPVIDAQPPANLVVNQCSPIELTVGAHLAPGASGVLTVDWFNGGNPVSGQHATTLRIAEAGPDDAGRYSAVLTNRIGSNATAITTSTTQVVVVPGPPGNICQSVPGDGDPGAKEPDSVGPGGTTGIPPAQPIDPGTSRSTGAEPISVAISRVSTQLPGPTRIWVGQSLQYHATVRPASADQTVVWSSSKPTVAAVDATGSVKGLGEGKTVLRAVAANGAAATKTINVVKRVTKVAGPVSKATLVKGTSMKIPVVAYSQVGGKAKLTWKSSRPKVAKVSLNGKVTALSPGRTTITATALSGKQMRMVVKVVAKAKVASRVSATLAGEGANIWVKTELTPNGATVAKAPIFRSSNPKVATVDAAGRIEGKKAGKATITVRYAGKVVKRNIAIGQ